MRKIISVFQRNHETDRLIRDEVTLGAEWVLAGEGLATQKFDGACCMVEGGLLFKRYDAKNGKTPPVGFRPAQDHDPVTGHMPGWLLIGDGPEDQWFRVAMAGSGSSLPDGTYEAVGPHFQKNPEGLDGDFLLRHGSVVLLDLNARSFEYLREYLEPLDIEGIVFHHPDGRMAKVKKKDFGLSRIPREATTDEKL